MRATASAWRSVTVSTVTSLGMSRLRTSAKPARSSARRRSASRCFWFRNKETAADRQLRHEELAAAGRGLGQARIWTQDGRLAVTVIQEGVVRVRVRERRPPRRERGAGRPQSHQKPQWPLPVTASSA
ncbi:hypothetical protein SAVIM40S_02966 [Streptomyces avidinii]